MAAPRKKTTKKTTTKKTSRRKTGAGAAEAEAVLDLQALGTGEDDPVALGGSRVSKSCSAGSNGCDIRCTPETLAAPAPGGIE